jgi:ATP-dependent Zn protease
MMILADAAVADSPLWVRIVFPIIPWVILFVLLWFVVKWQARATAKLLRRQIESVEAKLDRLIEVMERRSGDG